jgi:titin
MKKIKKNILKSFFLVCIGLTITTIVFASARALLDVPWRPGIPVFIEIWDNECTFTYKAPPSDGGTPITDYYIEAKSDAWGWKDWRLQGKTLNLKYTATNMKEGSKAIFRVRACNKVGLSEPSPVSDTITFMNPY